MTDTNDKPRSILVVDDSVFTRKRVRQLLTPEGYAMEEAGSGLAALDAIDKNEFSCILTDLVMPDLDGFGLLAEIQKRRLKTPIVVLSADVQRTTRERCAALGAAAFLQKPVNPDALLSTISEVFGGRS